MNELCIMVSVLAVWLSGVLAGHHLRDRKEKSLTKHLRMYNAALEEEVDKYRELTSRQSDLITELMVQNNDLEVCNGKLQRIIRGETMSKIRVSELIEKLMREPNQNKLINDPFSTINFK